MGEQMQAKRSNFVSVESADFSLYGEERFDYDITGLDISEKYTVAR